MKSLLMIVTICVCAVGCENRNVGPAEEILRENYREGALTMWAYDVRKMPVEDQQRIKQSLINDATRLLDAYLLIGCTNQTQFSSLDDKVRMTIGEISKEMN